MVTNSNKRIKVEVNGKLTSLCIDIRKSRYFENTTEYVVSLGFKIIGFPDNFDDAKDIVTNALITNGYQKENIKFI